MEPRAAARASLSDASAASNSCVCLDSPVHAQSLYHISSQNMQITINKLQDSQWPRRTRTEHFILFPWVAGS
jgi:hypothetical protein